MVTFRVYPTPSADSDGPQGDTYGTAPGSRARRPEPSFGPYEASSGGPTSLSNVIAALASFFLPGLGQLIQGRLMSAAFLCLATTVGYFLWFLVLPLLFAFALHVVAVLDAALYTKTREPLFSAQFSS